MIGEITCAINRVEEQIEQLFDEKEEFIMAYEDALPRTMYLKKLTEIDSRIDELIQEHSSFSFLSKYAKIGKRTNI